MPGIVVVAHQHLARELLATATHIMGRQEPALVGVDINPEWPYEEARDHVREALAQIMGPEGAIILTDMYGGTPANLGMDFLEPGRVEVIAGVNLPMLVRLLTYRERPLEEQSEERPLLQWDWELMGQVY